MGLKEKAKAAEIRFSARKKAPVTNFMRCRRAGFERPGSL
jgi:hypothetical protein